MHKIAIILLTLVSLFISVLIYGKFKSQNYSTDFSKKVPNAKTIAPVAVDKKLPRYSQFYETVPGLMTTTVQSGSSVYSLIVYPTNFSRLQEYARDDFPCEAQVKGYRGNMSGYVFKASATYERDESGVPTTVYLGDATSSDPEAISVFDFGDMEIYYGTEQDGFSGQLVPASVDPVIDLNGYAKRVSCFDAQFFGFVINPKTNKLQRVSFVKDDGSTQVSIYIPKGVKIPQRDAEGNMIEDRHNAQTNERIKTRYKFNVETLNYEEIESWVQ